VKRAALGIASLGVATAACLAVVYALREPPARDAVPAPAAVGPAIEEPRVEEPGGAPAPPAAPSEAEFLGEVVQASEAQEQALRDALLRIEGAEDLALAARLERWQEALRAARAAAPGAPIFEFPTMLAELFLRMDAVQSELAALSPSARAGELANIRRELGFDDDAIARMAALDERREGRWQNGLAYMQERERLMSTFEGGALETELRALREERFAHEARTIEAEEREGFYRFERPRIYGRN
jgi:hypothetical protein